MDRPAKKPKTPLDPKRVRTMRRTIIWTAVAVVAVAALAFSMVYTERSSFCGTCHEMRPYTTAWSAGPHATKAECIDCHVNPGVLAHIMHKPIALKEVWDHLFTSPKFPNYAVELPNSRCIRCHPSVPDTTTTRFSHKAHVSRGKCKDCHAQTGHVITFASLAAEGVLKASVTTPSIAPTGTTPSSVAGHMSVICQRCHDQAHMKCSQCHSSPHENKGECSDCHQPGTKFVFSHPAGTDCASCHEPPKSHFGSQCSGCHTTSVPFKDTVFDHKSTSTKCQTCHTPPSSHYGADCGACHKPSVPFAKTTFSHPSAGEHNWRRIACAKCHPNTYSTAYCTCHNGHPPRD